VTRSTFLLDKEGNILQSWKNVKATGHAQKILKECQAPKKLDTKYLSKKGELGV